MTTRRQYLARLGALCSLSGGAVLGTNALVSQEATRTGNIDVEGDASAFLGIDVAHSPKIVWNGGSDTVNDLVTATNNLSSPANLTFTDRTAVGDSIGLHDGSTEVGDNYTVTNVSSGASASVNASLPESESLANSRLNFEIRAESGGSTITVDRSVVVEDGLVAYYPFEKTNATNGTTGNVPDRSQYSNDGTPKNIASFDTAGKVGNAYTFNGTSSHIVVSDDPTINFIGDFTVAAWAKTSETGGDRRLVYKYNNADGTGDGYAIYLNTAGSGRYSAILFSGGTEYSVASSNSYSDGAWHHVTVVRDGTTLRLYIDGNEVNSGTVSSGDLSNTGSLYIGQDKFDEFYWDGKIDDVRLYNRALPAGEIQDLYDLDFTDISASGGGGNNNLLSTSLAPSPKLFLGGGTGTVSDLVTATNTSATSADITYTDTTSSGLNVELYDDGSKQGESHTDFDITSGATASSDIYIPEADESLIGNSLTFDVKADDGTTTETRSESVVVEDGLVAYYPFEASPSGSGGTVPDRSTNTNDGTTSGGVDTGNDGTQPSGKVGGAFSFDGSDDWVTVGNNSTINFTGDFTLATWAKPSVTENSRILYKWDNNVGAYDGYAIYWTGSFEGKLFDDGNQYTVASGSYTPGSWHHVALVREGSELSLYIDGARVNSSEGTAGDVTNEGSLFIGRARYGPYPFTGKIDDVRLYERALGANEISDLFDRNYLGESGGGGGDILSTAVAPSPKIVRGAGSDTINNLVTATNDSSNSATITYTDTTAVGRNIELYDDGEERGNTHTENGIASGATDSIDVAIPETDDPLFGSTLTFDVTANDGSTSETQHESVIIEDGIVAYYPFEKTSATNGTAGDVPDRSQNSNAGTPKRSVSFTNDGEIGNAYSFDGSDSRIEVSDGPSLNFSGDFTIACWATTFGTKQGLISKHSTTGTNGDGYSLSMKSSGAYEGRLWDNGTKYSVTSSSGNNTGAWNHITFVRDNDTLILYLNGSQDDSITATSGSVSNDRTLFIGQDDSGEYNWMGTIDDVRLYARALDAPEVQDLFDLTFTD